MKKIMLILIACLAIGQSERGHAQQPSLTNNSVPKANPANQPAWRQRLLAKHQLPGTGCFSIKFPSETWQQVPCGTPSTHAKGPAQKSLKNASVVGNGNDVVANAVGGLVSSVVGSFSSAVDILSVESVIDGSPTLTGAYSLQINPDVFALPSSVCARSNHPTDCTGWLQFIFDSDPGGSSVYMEYWLFDYGASCPGDGGIPQLSGLQGGFWFHPKGSTTDCVYNAAPSTGPSQDISKLGQIQMLAGSEGQDSVFVILPDGNGIAAALPDGILSLSAKWQRTEFNVFGIYDGARAHFNTNAAAIAHLVVNNATTNTPQLQNDGFTGETNTLNIQLPGCATGGSTPSITFAEFLGNYKATTCPPAIVSNQTPLTPCQIAINGVTADQKALAQAQAKLSTQTCQGGFRLECVQTVKSAQQALTDAGISRSKACSK